MTNENIDIRLRVSKSIVLYEASKGNQINLETVNEILQDDKKRKQLVNTYMDELAEIKGKKTKIESTIKFETNNSAVQTRASYMMIGKCILDLAENEKFKGQIRNIDKLRKEYKNELDYNNSTINYGENYERYPLNLANEISESYSQLFNSSPDEVFEKLKTERGRLKILDTVSADARSVIKIKEIIRDISLLENPDLLKGNVELKYEDGKNQNVHQKESKKENPLIENQPSIKDEKKIPKFKASYYDRDRTRGTKKKTISGMSCKAILSALHKVNENKEDSFKITYCYITQYEEKTKGYTKDIGKYNVERKEKTNHYDAPESYLNKNTKKTTSMKDFNSLIDDNSKTGIAKSVGSKEKAKTKNMNKSSLEKEQKDVER